MQYVEERLHWQRVYRERCDDGGGTGRRPRGLRSVISLPTRRRLLQEAVVSLRASSASITMRAVQTDVRQRRSPFNTDADTLPPAPRRPPFGVVHHRLRIVIRFMLSSCGVDMRRRRHVRRCVRPSVERLLSFFSLPPCNG